MNDLITQAEALELFSYNPNTGDLRWRISRSNRALVGAIAGSLGTQKSGYQCIGIKVNNRRYLAHRLIWLMQTGVWPDEIDHINHNASDNRWQNLRAANHSMNGKNQSLYSTNISGHVGIYRNKKNDKWKVQIRVQGKLHYLGRFVNFDDAVAARKAAERKYGFHPNHGALTITEAHMLQLQDER